jgi:hypothetical protein
LKLANGCSLFALAELAEGRFWQCTITKYWVVQTKIKSIAQLLTFLINEVACLIPLA